MNGLPYYKAYPRDFMEGTIGMSFELKGAYRLALDLIYMQGGKLPDDARYIAGLLGCSPKAWNGYRAKLIEMGKLSVDGGHLVNHRAIMELKKLAKLSDIQRDKRLGKRKNNDLQEPQFHQPEPEPEPVVREEGKPSSSGRAKSAALPAKTRMTPDWHLSEECRDFARSYGFTDAQIEEELADFRVYWIDRRDAQGSKSQAGWDMTWRNRVKAVAARFPKPMSNVVPLQPKRTGNAWTEGFLSAIHDARMADGPSDDALVPLLPARH